MLESGKIFLLGILVYVSPQLFFVVGERWFPELANRNEWMERVRAVGRNSGTAAYCAE